MRDPYETYRQGDPDLMGRNHKHMPQWHEFGERLIWIVGGLFVLMAVAMIIAVVA
jgi:hypothetical protein